MSGFFDCFAACGVGLEPILAAELRALARTHRLELRGEEPGGVDFAADLAGIQGANLHLRTASRVLARIGGFHASAFHELERRARRLPWELFLAPGAAVTFRVTSRKSRLYHQGAVAQRLLSAAAEQVGGLRVAPAAEEDESATAAGVQVVVVRLFRDECTVSADSSGELLHRRGYRLATAKAPLRETLAAAMLLAGGWEGTAPLLDPMCGSGTIPIEGALLARRIPPGLHRRFAFEDWPGHDGDAWRRLRDEAAGQVLPRASAPILGSDRDEGAIEAAAANAARAGVRDDIVFRRAAISAVEPPEQAGWLVCNPPYGTRVGERARLRNLYAQLGNVARRHCPGWRIVLLSAHAELERQTRLPLARTLETVNGGIRVHLAEGTIPLTTTAAPA